MTVCINEVTITESEVQLSCTNLEGMFLSENFYEDIEDEPVIFSFSREKEGQMKYLYKICMSQKKCQSAKSIGAKIESLCTCITQISDAFQVK